MGKKFLFWIGALFTLTVPALLAVLFRDANTTWAAALCGVFITLLSKFDDLIELSFGPLRAKMKESIKEVAASVDQLRALAASSAQVALTDLMSSNFMGGTTLANRIKMHDHLIKTLRDLGVTETQVQEADLEWRKGMGIIYHRVIRGKLEGRVQRNVLAPNASPELLVASRDFQELVDFPSWMGPSADKMEQFINSKGFMTPDVQSCINEYRHYCNTGEILRLETLAE